MKITLKDRSLYFKGLLLLVRKDRNIHDREKEMMLHVGNILGFEKTFCENAIQGALINPHIQDVPPRFSNSHIAECFIRDGLMFSFIDGTMDNTELAWLHSVADANGLNPAWMQNAVKDIINRATDALMDKLEANLFEWE